MPFTTYILKSEKTGRHYYGHTSDVEARLKRHNGSQVRSTKAYTPWRLLYSENFTNKSEAYKREMFFKSIEGYNWLKTAGII